MHTALFDRLLDTTHYVLVVADVKERGQYDFSGLYKLDRQYVLQEIADEAGIEPRYVTGRRANAFISELNFSDGFWQWMHLACDNRELKKTLDLIDAEKTIDMHARMVGLGYEDDNDIYIIGKSVDDVCEAGLAALGTLDVPDNAHARWLRHKLTERTLG
jgi:hypothetical protein